MIPMIFIAGWGLKPSALEPLAAGLADRVEARHTSALDLLRAGDPVADLVRQIADCPTPPWVVGWSMGAPLAAQALQAGARVAGLVLLSGTPRFCEAEDFLHGTPVELVRGMKRACRANPTAVMDSFLSLCATTPEQVPALAAHRDDDGPRLIEGLDYLLRTDLRGTVIPPPPRTLLVHGKADRITPLNAIWEWEKLLPGSHVIRLERLGHDLPLAAARMVAGLIRSELSG